LGKKISVIGSGFAGLAAAACCAKNGHDVTVYEKNHTIGEVLDSPTIQDKATELGNRMRTENGVKQAVMIIDQILSK
jgi:NADPH-dependent 2,4-dienoyl-CoA reductase/sulfur reductase-like enzyme